MFSGSLARKEYVLVIMSSKNLKFSLRQGREVRDCSTRAKSEETGPSYLSLGFRVQICFFSLPLTLIFRWSKYKVLCPPQRTVRHCLQDCRSVFPLSSSASGWICSWVYTEVCNCTVISRSELIKY